MVKNVGKDLVALMRHVILDERQADNSRYMYFCFFHLQNILKHCCVPDCILGCTDPADNCNLSAMMIVL